MSFDYYLLLCLSFLPLYYKIEFWKNILNPATKENLSRGYSHFLTYIEFPLLLSSYTILFDRNLEVFMYNFFLYFFIILHIFVFGKVFRGNLEFSKTWKQSMYFSLSWVLIIFSLASLFWGEYLYAAYASIFFLLPIYFYKLWLWKK